MQLEHGKVVVGPWVLSHDQQEVIKMLSELLAQIVDGEITHLAIQARYISGQSVHYGTHIRKHCT